MKAACCCCCCCCHTATPGWGSAPLPPVSAAAGAPQATLSVLATEWLSTESALLRTHDADAATREGASQSAKRAAPLVAPSTRAARPVHVAAAHTQVFRASGSHLKHRSRFAREGIPVDGGPLLYIEMRLIAHLFASRRAHCHRVRPRQPGRKIRSAACVRVRFIPSRACDILRVRRVRPGRVEVLAPFFCASDEHIHVRVTTSRAEAHPGRPQRYMYT